MNKNNVLIIIFSLLFISGCENSGESLIQNSINKAVKSKKIPEKKHTVSNIIKDKTPSIENVTTTKTKRD